MSTKVFCVGFHKTGTSSLGEALRRLGFRVADATGINDPSISENVWEIVRKVVPRYDAFQDNPWPVLYSELDIMYPGSKFILTWRNSEDWIRSVIGHFGGKSTAMRRWIYGHGDPVGHEREYLARYAQHNEDVKTFFANREGRDFLVMKIMEGEGWERLCPFLGVSSPMGDDFPHQNQAMDRAGGGR